VCKRLIVAIANFLAPRLRPRYIVAVEERVYETLGKEALLVGIPDEAIARSTQNWSRLEPVGTAHR
jgi:hypothetical protein